MPYTLKTKTDNLTVVQQTVTDTLHQEVTLKKTVVQKVAVRRVLKPGILKEG